jgi:3-hydroxyisobutyrate dehydrogenase-like beta-hydroxyacid dehydrogenase
MKIGWIGLGRMGSAMAMNLIKAGHEVTAYNRTPGKMRALAEEGAATAAVIAEACKGDVVVTMLADDAAVDTVVFGDHGVLASLGKGKVHISMSTISVALSERLAAAHADARQPFVAAPVFGRPNAVAAGNLFIVAGGAPADVEAYGPVFQALGQRTIHIGDAPHAANLVKLSGNFPIACVLQAVAKYLTYGGLVIHIELLS